MHVVRTVLVYVEPLCAKKANGAILDTYPNTNARLPTILFRQIYRNALHVELAEMRETRKMHAINLLKARVVSARAITAETR